jgi:hypothetical protein
MVLLASGVFLTLSSVALAQNGYEGRAGSVQAQVESGSTLPFTGLDLALLIGGGVALLLIGATLRRITRERS